MSDANHPRHDVAFLWQRSQEHVRRSQFAAAAADLAEAYSLLEAAEDPSMYAVQVRWLEVYRAGAEESARPAVFIEEVRAPEERAEAAANRGDFAEAIALYDEIVLAQPHNELAAERLDELRQFAGLPPRPKNNVNTMPAVSIVEPSVVTLDATPDATATPTTNIVDAKGKRIDLLQTLLARVRERRRAA